MFLRAFRPGPYRKQCSPRIPAQPLLAGGRLAYLLASIWPTSPLEVEVRHLICEVFFFFPLPVMLLSEIPKLPTDPLVRGFPGVWKHFLLHYPSLEQVSIPNLSLFLFFVLLLSNKMGCHSGCPVSSARVQRWFCGISSAFK